MTGAEAVGLLPCLASASVSAWVGVHCWRRRARPGAGAYAVVALSQAACTLGFVLELLSPGLSGKIFWDDVQYLALAPLPAGMVVFALDYTGRRPANPARTLGLLTLPVAAFAALSFTDRLHGLVRVSPRLAPGEPFSVLVYGFSPLTLACGAYILALCLAACVLLTARWIRVHPLYRAQAGLVQLGVLLPWVGGVLALTLLRDSPLRDLSPLTFGAANLLVAWGLFRVRLFDVVPVARHAVVESMGDAVYVLDAAGRVVDLNPAARSALGETADGAIGRDAAAILPLPPGSLPGNGERREVEAGSGPDRRHVEVSVYPLPGPWGEPAGRVVVVRDITERRRVEEALREARDGLERRVRERTRELEAANAALRAEVEQRAQAQVELRRAEEQLRHSQKMEAVGRLAGGIAHDFNNLLMAIGGNAQLLLRRAGPDDPSRPGLEEVKKATDRAADLTRQLLAFSRRQVLAPRVVDLAGAVTEMQRMLERLLGPGTELALRLAADTPCVRADATQVEQVMMNLVVNARDAMPGGGVIRVETGVAVLTGDDVCRHPFLRPGRYAELVVADDGCGMDENTLERIFEPFFTTKAVGRGTGLGLSTVYGIVKQSGGFVVAESAPGAGSVFRVYLPPVEEPAAVPARAPRGPTPRGWETVLLVEDEDAVRGVVRETLRLSGYQVLEARGGAEAVEMAEGWTTPIHLVLADVMMPGPGGPETARRVLALHPESRVLYLSGQPMEDGNAGPHGDLLQKPVSPDALARRVREVLDRPAGAPR